MKIKILLTLVSALLTGCYGNTDQTKMQWMPDMVDSPTVKAHEGFINPPEGSVSTKAILYPKTIEESAKLLRNPFPPGQPEIVAKGKVLFNTFCVPCHGAAGDGKHKLKGGYPNPPAITSKYYADKEDGFFFHRITFGSAIMPGYGHAISPHERWQIIHYLRTLQKKG